MDIFRSLGGEVAARLWGTILDGDIEFMIMKSVYELGILVQYWRIMKWVRTLSRREGGTETLCNECLEKEIQAPEGVWGIVLYFL